MNDTYWARIWILMNGIWPVELCCKYYPLFTLHWRTRWWLRRCISYFQPRQYPLWITLHLRPVFLHSEDIDVDLFFLTARARDRAGAAMCMRSTPGCGILAGPSLVLEDFRSPKSKDPQAFQVRNVPARLEDPAGPEACNRRGRVQLKWYDMHKQVICLSYINAQ